MWWRRIWKRKRKTWLSYGYHSSLNLFYGFYSKSLHWNLPRQNKNPDVLKHAYAWIHAHSLSTTQSLWNWMCMPYPPYLLPQVDQFKYDSEYKQTRGTAHPKKMVKRQAEKRSQETYFIITTLTTLAGCTLIGVKSALPHYERQFIHIHRKGMLLKLQL